MPKREKSFSRTLRFFAGDPAAVIGAAILIIISVLSLLAPWLAPYDPYEIHPANLMEGPSSSFLLGTDDLGRDILSRLMYGGRISLVAGLMSTGIGLVLGVLLGLISGFYQKLDNFIMRIVDIMMSIPSILLAVVIVAVLGPNLYNVMIAVGVRSIPSFARITRSQVLSVRETEYVAAARAAGASDFRILFKHILGNCLAPILVYGTLNIAGAILNISLLSFLGLGVQPPTAEWGAMANLGRGYLRQAPHLTFFPSIAIFLVVMSFNLLGDSFRDAMDPRLNY